MDESFQRRSIRARGMLSQLVDSWGQAPWLGKRKDKEWSPRALENYAESPLPELYKWNSKAWICRVYLPHPTHVSHVAAILWVTPLWCIPLIRGRGRGVLSSAGRHVPADPLLFLHEMHMFLEKWKQIFPFSGLSESVAPQGLGKPRQDSSPQSGVGCSGFWGEFSGYVFRAWINAWKVFLSKMSALIYSVLAPQNLQKLWVLPAF